jgi:protein TonB
MDRARALPHLPDLDAKRIAATSLAIAVHVAVLMLLMLPAQVAPPRTVVDTPMQVIETARPPDRIAPAPPIQPITREPRRPDPVPVQTPVPIENLTPTPNDPYVESVTVDPPVDSGFSVDPAPAFAQIRADRAPAPPYPPQALHRRLSGVVTLRVLVDVTGHPVEATVETSSGASVLDEAALRFVLKRWHFVPATQGGQAIAAYALVPISFELQP